MNCNKAILRALIDTIMFLEFSDNENINPDAAVAQMEQIASFLQDMDKKEIEQFVETCSLVAQEYKDDAEKTNFILSICENFGLIE
jgi:diadenosine tetraphosphate (Ap4A) HIT family hydrolase